MSKSSTARAQTALYFVSFVALGLTGGSLGPTLMGLAAHTRTSLQAISFVFLARSFGYLFGSLWGGKLFDRAPGHRVLRVALFLMAVTVTLTPLAVKLWLLLAVALVLGATEGALDVGGNTLMLWTRRENTGHYLNALHFFFGLGALLAPLLVAQSYARSHDINLAYWLIAALAAALSLGFWRAPGPTPAAREETGGGPVDLRLVALIALVFFFYTGVEVSFGGWIFTYAVAVNAGTMTTAAYLTSVFWGALTLGRLLAIPLAARFRPRAVLFADFAGSLLCLWLILVFRSTSVLWVGTFGLGLFMASIFPTLFAFAARRMAITGRVTSWLIIGASLGCKVLPLLIGQLFAAPGPRSLLAASIASLSLAVGAFLIALRYTAARPDFTA